MEGTVLAKLISLAMPLCRSAERAMPRRGPGAPPEYPDWKLAVLIMAAVAARRKSKSAQYRYLTERKNWFADLLQLPRLPARSTYFDRYRRAHAIFECAVRLQGRQALHESVANATLIAADKSLIAARGPKYAPAARREGRRPRGVDIDADWSYSKHHGWVYGYSYEVVVCATAESCVFPLQISVSTASRSEHRSLAEKIGHIPQATMYVIADAGYDGNANAEAIEYDHADRPNGRRFLCPLVARGAKPRVGQTPHRGRRERSRQRRAARFAFYQSREGKRLFRRRGLTVEPFNEWFKRKFDLHDRVWHRGLENNQTQIAAAVFVYQLLLRYHYQQGGRNGETQWILDAI
jgi:hypothetical protein